MRLVGLPAWPDVSRGPWEMAVSDHFGRNARCLRCSRSFIARASARICLEALEASQGGLTKPEATEPNNDDVYRHVAGACPGQ